MPQLAPPLDRLHASLTEAVAGVDAACHEQTDAQFCWRPRPNAWSSAELVEHLNAVAEAYLDRLDSAITRGRAAGRTSTRTEYRYGWFLRLFIRTAGPEGRAIRAPKLFRPPQHDEVAPLSRDAVLLRFHTLHQRLADLMAAADGLDLARVRHGNPLLGLLRMPVGASFEILVGHMHRHLAQLTRISDQPGYPS